jgi:Mannose-6-phosphate isomerase
MRCAPTPGAGSGGRRRICIESTLIPLGTLRRLKNPDKVPLEIIEVQSGTYLGEDDIVRYEDSYGRFSTRRPTAYGYP